MRKEPIQKATLSNDVQTVLSKDHFNTGGKAVASVRLLILVCCVVFMTSCHRSKTDEESGEAPSTPLPVAAKTSLPNLPKIQIQSGAFFGTFTSKNVFKDGPKTLSRKARLETAIEGRQNDLTVGDWTALLDDVRSGPISREDLERIIHSPGAQIDFVLQAAAVGRLLSSMSVKGFTEKQVRDLLGDPTKATAHYLLYKYNDGVDFTGGWEWTVEMKDGVVVEAMAGEISP